MAARHGGDRIADALQAHGVEAVFTLCGGHISPILAAAKARGIRIVDTRDEATAVFAADAHARLAGRPGVAAVTAGPGISNTITALKNAQLAQSPLLLLGGAAPTALQGRGALQDIDQRPLVTPHVKRFFRLRRVRDLAPALAEQDPREARLWTLIQRGMAERAPGLLDGLGDISQTVDDHLIQRLAAALPHLSREELYLRHAATLAAVSALQTGGMDLLIEGAPARLGDQLVAWIVGGLQAPAAGT